MLVLSHIATNITGTFLNNYAGTVQQMQLSARVLLPVVLELQQLQSRSVMRHDNPPLRHVTSPAHQCRILVQQPGGGTLQ
jgi:hypothetical protein